MIKFEELVKRGFSRHSGRSRNPGLFNGYKFAPIPGFAGVTTFYGTVKLLKS